MKKQTAGSIAYFLAPLFLLLVLLCFTTALSTLEEDQQLEEKQQLESVLMQASAACYATEGSYPASLQYLIDHYGVQINEDIYTVIYEPIASNLMPDITVLDTQP